MTEKYTGKTMYLKQLPLDINAEELILYLKDTPVKVALCGLHKRDAYNDIVGMEECPDGALGINLARNSLYNVLPEYMFHPIDRFDNIPANETKERFADELKAQEKEKENARRFFEPLDILLLKLKCDVRKAFEKYAETDVVLENALTDSMTEALRRNRFVRQTLKFMPSCKSIRGDKTLLTLMLRKILGEEGLKIVLHNQKIIYEDDSPRYSSQLDGEIGRMYAGNVFDEAVWCYDIHYWSDDDCNEQFLDFVDEIERFRQFVADYFLSVECILRFHLVKDESPLRLSDTFVYNYLNYNANI